MLYKKVVVLTILFIFVLSVSIVGNAAPPECPACASSGWISPPYCSGQFDSIVEVVPIHYHDGYPCNSVGSMYFTEVQCIHCYVPYGYIGSHDHSQYHNCNNYAWIDIVCPY